MKTRDKYKKLYDTLVSLENQGIKFDRKDLAEKTGYSEGTIGVYVRNKLKNTFVFDTDDQKFLARQIAEVDFPTFSDFMSQKGKRLRYQNNLFTTLRERSLQAFYNAISIYNNPIREYRVESFCILLSNSWEILLKGRIIETLGENRIYRADGKTMSFRKAIELVYTKHKDPVRKNLELLNDLRDHAAHLLLPDIQNTLSRIFQASVFNYLQALHAFNYPNPYIQESPGLLALVSDTSDVENGTIKLKYGSKTATHINDFLSNVTQEEKSINDSRYIIPVEYKVVLTKNTEEGDFKIATGSKGQPAMLINVPKDHNKTHPFRSTEIIEKINGHYNEKIINTYSIQAIIFKEKVKNSRLNEYHYYIENPKTHKFSQTFVDLIITRIDNNKDYIEVVRRKYGEYRKAKRKQKNKRI